MSGTKPLPDIVKAGEAGKKLRVLSIDVAVVNIGIWAGVIDPRNPGDQVTSYWRVVDAPAELGYDWPDIRKKRIFECCDAVDDWFEQKFPMRSDTFDVILIENQPLSMFQKKKATSTASNPTMFAVAHTMRRTLVRLFPDAYMADFVTPKLKLKALPDPTIGNDIEDSAKRYRAHKKATKEYVDSLEDIPKQKGKPLYDMADAYMQARAWFVKQEELRLAVIAHKTLMRTRADARKKIREEKKRAKEAEKAAARAAKKEAAAKRKLREVNAKKLAKGGSPNGS